MLSLLLLVRRICWTKNMGLVSAFCIMVIVGPAVGQKSERLDSTTLATWGAEALECIDRDHLVSGPKGDYYAETYPGRRRDRRPAFMWSSGVHLSAIAAAARWDAERYGDDLSTRIASLEPYWTEHDGVGGYDVLPCPATSDRYYDDNAWIALALLEAYSLTKEESRLERAVEIYEFLISGEDDEIDGGIYWRENEKTSKNTCINAPAAVVALRLHEVTGKKEYLETGRRLYEWTQTKLQDPASGLYWDNIELDGDVDRRQFSYNSALMIRAGLELHAITGEQEYLAEAKRVVRASVERWVDAATGAVRDGGKFAHLLLDALLEVAAVDGEAVLKDAVLKSAVYVRQDLRDEDGRYPHRWDKRPERPSWRHELIDQASAARLFFSAAIAVRE